MNLAFSTTFPKGLGHLSGENTNFVEKIWKGLLMNNLIKRPLDTIALYKGNPIYEINGSYTGKQKIHTIRKDKFDNWQIGKKIHFCINMRTKNHWQFAPILPVQNTQTIKITYSGKAINVYVDGKHFYYRSAAGQEWSDEARNNMLRLAMNDGFDSIDDFFLWFNEDYNGKIIHWTNMKY